MIFFEIVGAITVAFFVTVAISVLYSLFVHPLFQAISLTRWNIACEKILGGYDKNYPYWKVFKHYYSIGGWPGERTWNSVGEWRGIGRWEVYKSDKDEAP